MLKKQGPVPANRLAQDRDLINDLEAIQILPQSNIEGDTHYALKNSSHSPRVNTFHLKEITGLSQPESCWL